jgi:hypothetical protein
LPENSRVHSTGHADGVSFINNPPMLNSHKKTVIFSFLMLLFVVVLFFVKKNPATGFTVHGDAQSTALAKELFPAYIQRTSNWKFQDDKSLFVHVIGDSLRLNTDIIPNGTLQSLDSETQRKGIYFFRHGSAQVWMSARDLGTIRDHCRHNRHLRSMIKSLANSPYVSGSYYNVTGKHTPVVFPDYEQAKFDASASRFYIQSAQFDSAGYGIDYGKPVLYLHPGLQSALDTGFKNLITREVGAISNDLSGMARLCKYFHTHFRYGGFANYRLSINDLFRYAKIDGCTETALVISGMLRAFGFPAIMLWTVDMETARKTPPGSGISRGHQMVETFIGGTWLLLDGKGRYCDSYDPHNPFIIRHNPDSTVDSGFVLAKGIDSWDIGFTYARAYEDACAALISRLHAIEPLLEKPSVCAMKRY